MDFPLGTSMKFSWWSSLSQLVKRLSLNESRLIKLVRSTLVLPLSQARGDPVHLHQLLNRFFLLVKRMWSKVVLLPQLFPPIATAPTFTSGKKVADRINIGGWPTIKLFRQFKLVFKKAVAAASARPDDAFVWVSQIEKALTMEEFCDSGEFPELNALLGMEWEKPSLASFKRMFGSRSTNFQKQTR